RFLPGDVHHQRWIRGIPTARLSALPGDEGPLPGRQRLHDRDRCHPQADVPGRPDTRVLVLREHEVLILTIRPRTALRLLELLPEHPGQSLPRASSLAALA